MVVKEKDFDMYIGGGAAGGSPDAAKANVEGGVAEVAVDPTAVAGGETTAEVQADEIMKAAGEVGAEPVIADPAAPEVGADVATEVTTTDDATTEDAAGGDDISGDNLQKMLDALNEGSDTAAETTEEIIQTVEEVKTAVGEMSPELQTKFDDLSTKLAEKDANEIKLNKTIDVLKSEYEKTLSDKISLEYGTANDSKIAQIVNEDADVKNLIAAKLAKGDDATEKLTQAWRSGFESASGQNLDTILSAKKEAEVDVMASGEDAATTVGASSGSDIYL